MYKFGVLKEKEDVAFSYPNIWAVERTTGPERLIVAPALRHTDLMLQLARCWSSECSLLYVLLVSRTGIEPGRYQAPEPLSFEELGGFMATYAPFLESDGRHHFWIGSQGNNGTVVYDRHNVIYAYGDLDAYQRILVRNGLEKVAAVRIPCPHVHHYNEEDDAWERQIMRHWSWRRSPLQPNDEH